MRVRDGVCKGIRCVEPDNGADDEGYIIKTGGWVMRTGDWVMRIGG